MNVKLLPVSFLIPLLSSPHFEPFDDIGIRINNTANLFSARQQGAVFVCE
jgi:hypothetical protein